MKFLAPAPISEQAVSGQPLPAVEFDCVFIAFSRWHRCQHLFRWPYSSMRGTSDQCSVSSSVSRSLSSRRTGCNALLQCGAGMGSVPWPANQPLEATAGVPVFDRLYACSWSHSFSPRLSSGFWLLIFGVLTVKRAPNCVHIDRRTALGAVIEVAASKRLASPAMMPIKHR